MIAKTTKFLTSILILSCLVLSGNAFAFETDQYNLSPVPLADIGPEFDEYLVATLDEVISETNAEIDEIENCLENKNVNCGKQRQMAERSDELRSPDSIAKAVFKKLGDGTLPFTKVGTWIEKHEFRVAPARFKTGYRESVHFAAPMNYLTISPTINMYGTEFGTDKIAHIFQQGYDYYKIRAKAIDKNKTAEIGESEAVKFGRISEKTYFGTLVSAVYSNADLAANFAGMRFYQQLTEEIKIGDRSFAPILNLSEGRWVFNGNAKDLLKPYISNHLNEAYNPGKIYNIAGFRNNFREAVRKNACGDWSTRYPGLTAKDLENKSAGLESWYGEEYGYSKSKDFVTIANTCF
ncbi:MAG: hypothetical protein R2684_17015 [Pyrinomonadaceae bacterium]